MTSWIFFALLAAVFASLVAVLGKIGIQQIDSTLATAVRAVIMAAFLTATALLLGKGRLLATIDSKALLFITLSGIAGALSWLAYFVALQAGPATGVAALDRLSVVFVVLFAAVFLSEPLTWRSGLGAALMTFGAVLMTVR